MSNIPTRWTEWGPDTLEITKRSEKKRGANMSKIEIKDRDGNVRQVIRERANEEV